MHFATKIDSIHLAKTTSEKKKARAKEQDHHTRLGDRSAYLYGSYKYIEYRTTDV